jgi:hypothetical protein
MYRRTSRKVLRPTGTRVAAYNWHGSAYNRISDIYNEPWISNERKGSQVLMRRRNYSQVIYGLDKIFSAKSSTTWNAYLIKFTLWLYPFGALIETSYMYNFKDTMSLYRLFYHRRPSIALLLSIPAVIAAIVDQFRQIAPPYMAFLFEYRKFLYPERCMRCPWGIWSYVSS